MNVHRAHTVSTISYWDGARGLYYVLEDEEKEEEEDEGEREREEEATTGCGPKKKKSASWMHDPILRRWVALWWGLILLLEADEVESYHRACEEEANFEGMRADTVARQ